MKAAVLLELVTVSFGIMATWDSTGAMWIAVSVSYVVLSAEQLSLSSQQVSAQLNINRGSPEEPL
jgi:hypothetical protein